MYELSGWPPKCARLEVRLGERCDTERDCVLLTQHPHNVSERHRVRVVGWSMSTLEAHEPYSGLKASFIRTGMRCHLADDDTAAALCRALFHVQGVLALCEFY